MPVELLLTLPPFPVVFYFIVSGMANLLALYWGSRWLKVPSATLSNALLVTLLSKVAVWSISIGFGQFLSATNTTVLQVLCLNIIVYGLIRWRYKCTTKQAILLLALLFIVLIAVLALTYWFLYSLLSLLF